MNGIEFVDEIYHSNAPTNVSISRLCGASLTISLSAGNDDRGTDQKDLYYLRGKALGEYSIQGTVTLHIGQGVFFPVINTFSNLYDIEAMKLDVKTDIVATVEKRASIDGEMIKEDHTFRVSKAPFDLVVPTGGFQMGQLIVGAGSHKSATDGHWILILPRSEDNRCLDQGHHKISFGRKTKRGFHTAASYNVIQL